MSPGRRNFVLWRLMFVAAASMEIASSQLPGDQDLRVTPRFLEHLFTFIIISHDFFFCSVLDCVLAVAFTFRLIIYDV